MLVIAVPIVRVWALEPTAELRAMVLLGLTVMMPEEVPLPPAQPDSVTV